MVKNNLSFRSRFPLNSFFHSIFRHLTFVWHSIKFSKQKKKFSIKNIFKFYYKNLKIDIFTSKYTEKTILIPKYSQICSQISPPNYSSASFSTASDSNIYPHRTTEFSKHKTETRHQSKRIPKIHHPWELNRQHYRWSSWDLICFLASSLVLKFQKYILFFWKKLNSTELLLPHAMRIFLKCENIFFPKQMENWKSRPTQSQK